MIAAVQLGDTDDPRELIPGDADALRGTVRVLRREHEHLAGLAHALATAEVAGFTGRAAAAYGYSRAQLSRIADGASRSTGDAARTLAVYADALEDAQGRARQAIALWNDAERREKAARRNWVAAKAKQDAADLLIETAAVVLTIATTIARIPPVFADPTTQDRARAQRILDDARSDLDDAGDRAAAALDPGADWRVQLLSFAVGATPVVLAGAQWGRDRLSEGVALLQSMGAAVLDHPDLFGAEVAGGLLMLGGGLTFVGGLPLDATGVGAVAGGLELNAAGVAMVGAGGALYMQGVTGLAQHAASDDRVDPDYEQIVTKKPHETYEDRNVDGTYRGRDRAALDKEKKALDDIDSDGDYAAPVERQQVRAQVEGGREGGRYYDGLAQKPDGTWEGIEVKSGGAARDAGQRGFDELVSYENPAYAVLDGKRILITSVRERIVP